MYVCQNQGHEDVLNHHELLLVSKEKYLGALITDDCSDNEDVIRKNEKCIC